MNLTLESFIKAWSFFIIKIFELSLLLHHNNNQDMRGG